MLYSTVYFFTSSYFAKYIHFVIAGNSTWSLWLLPTTEVLAANFHNIQTNMDLLWNELFWFPEGVTWEDLSNDPNVYIPQIEDIGLLSIFIGLVLLIIRFLSER